MTLEEFLNLSDDEKLIASQHWTQSVAPQLIERALNDGTLPSIIRYHNRGGVAHFSFVENIQNSIVAISDAIERHFLELPEYDLAPFYRLWFNRESLNIINPTCIDRDTFYGTCWDIKTKRLIFTNPTIMGSPGETRGEYAYAFAFPPHQISLEDHEIENIFDEIDQKIFPQNEEIEILDWASPNLINVSNYFEEGFEYWGAFLFSIYVPSQRKLSIISASTTD